MPKNYNSGGGNTGGGVRDSITNSMTVTQSVYDDDGGKNVPDFLLDVLLQNERPKQSRVPLSAKELQDDYRHCDIFSIPPSIEDNRPSLDGNDVHNPHHHYSGGGGRGYDNDNSMNAIGVETSLLSRRDLLAYPSSERHGKFFASAKIRQEGIKVSVVVVYYI